jgi:hypothetical protein
MADALRLMPVLAAPAGKPSFLRSLTELESRRVKDVPSGGSAFFSPDGRYVVSFTNVAPTVMGKLALSGGAANTICPHEGGFAGAAWTADDTIYFVTTNPGGLMSVVAGGGQPKEVAKIDFAGGEGRARSYGWIAKARRNPSP